MLRKRDESSNAILPKFTLMLWNAVQLGNRAKLHSNKKTICK